MGGWRERGKMLESIFWEPRFPPLTAGKVCFGSGPTLDPWLSHSTDIRVNLRGSRG